MKTLQYQNKKPQIGQRVFLAEGAKVIGEALLADDVNIWFNCVVRADVNFIKIGANTNVQDLSMLHVTEENSLTIGKNVTIGHSVVLHGCKIGDSCLIGMGSIILDGAQIGENCLVAAGSLVSPGKIFPPYSLIKGRPAKVERELTLDERTKIAHHFESYVGYKNTYLEADQNQQ